MLGNKRKNPEIDTLVGRNTRVSGDIQFRGGFHVDGVHQGQRRRGA
jgi:cytoskeletal protein CcmA (bactofilin family)